MAQLTCCTPWYVPGRSRYWV